MRDRGVDLIAFLDLKSGFNEFKAWPIQVKAATGRVFCINKKYQRFPDIVHVFICGLHNRHPPDFYLLTQGNAVEVGDQMGWTRTRSWTDKGAYTTTRPGKRLLKLLDKYKVPVGKWRDALGRAV